MASRLIIWILLTMMSLQGAFAASLFHCPVSSQKVRNSHFSSAFPAPKSANPDFGTAQPLVPPSPDAGHHHNLSSISASGINHHAKSHDVHHHHKMPCCDSAGGGVPSLSFLLPAGQTASKFRTAAQAAKNISRRPEAAAEAVPHLTCLIRAASLALATAWLWHDIPDRFVPQTRACDLMFFLGNTLCHQVLFSPADATHSRLPADDLSPEQLPQGHRSV